MELTAPAWPRCTELAGAERVPVHVDQPAGRVLVDLDRPGESGAELSAAGRARAGVELARVHLGQPGPAASAAGRARVWRVHLDQPGEPGPALSAAERARAAGYACPVERRRFAVAHAALRSILGAACGLAPDRVEFATEPSGRPLIVPCGRRRPPDFSLSHSGEWALVAVAPPGARVGVDVERVSAELDWLAMARALYRPEEVDRLLAAPPARRRGDYFRLWTAKEAYIKADGVGLAGLRDALVAGATVGPPGRAVPVRWLDVAPGYRAALVVRS